LTVDGVGMLALELQDGSVRVQAELRVNDDPAFYGCPDIARGFPVLYATIDPPGRSYNDMLGWIQVLRDPRFPGGILLDSLEMLGDPKEVTHPFCYFGYAPTLFDAPHTPPDRDFDWVAHTFLAGTAGIHQDFEARAGLGFRWGYRIRDGVVSVIGLSELGSDAWDSLLPFLRVRCPGWRFAPGFAL
jgi:hypothetical protein